MDMSDLKSGEEAKVVISYEAFESFIKATSAIGEEIMVMVDKDGIKVRQMDIQHIMLVSATLFDVYEFSYSFEDPTVLAIPTDILKNFKFKKDTKVVLTIKAGEAKIEFVNGDIRIERPLEIVNIYKSLDEPNWDFGAYVDVSVDHLKIFLKGVSKVSRNLLIEADQDKFVFSSPGEVKSIELRLKSYSGEVKEPVKVAFGVDYIREIIKALSSVADTVRIHIKTNRPAKIFKLKSKIKLSYGNRSERPS